MKVIFKLSQLYIFFSLNWIKKTLINIKYHLYDWLS